MIPFLSEDLIRTPLLAEVLIQKASQATGSPHPGVRLVLILHENSWGQDDRGCMGRESLHLTLTKRVAGNTAILSLLKMGKHLSSNSPSLQINSRSFKIYKHKNGWGQGLAKHKIMGQIYSED